MSYSATATLHSILLAASTNKQPVFDLDLTGVWAILAAGQFAMWPVLSTSKTLYESPFRAIFMSWSMVMVVGTFFAMVPIYMTYAKEPPCVNSAGALLQHPYQVGQSDWNCTYSCFDSHRIMRSPSEIQVFDARMIYGDRWGYFKALAGYVVSASTTIFILSSGLGYRGYLKWLQHKKRKDPSFDCVAKARSERTFSVLHPRNRAERFAVASFYCNQGCSIACVVLCEIYLLGSNLPMDEQAYNVSQWGCAVAVGLVIIATMINKFNMWKASQTQGTDAHSSPAPETTEGLESSGDTLASPQTPAEPEKSKEEPQPVEPKSEEPEDGQTMQTRRITTLTRNFTMPIREVRTGLWDKFQDFFHYLSEPPQQWRPSKPSGGFVNFSRRRRGG